MIRTLLLIFLFQSIGCGSLICQSLQGLSLDTLNKFNSKGNKNGYWVELVDRKLEPVKKKKNAAFFRYIYYEDGLKLDDFNHRIYAKVILETDGNKMVEGEITILNGEYRILDKNKRVGFIEVYENGKKKMLKCYDLKTGMLLELTDYHMKYKEQEHSFCIKTDQMDNGEFKTIAYYRKGEKGWGIYREK